MNDTLPLVGVVGAGTMGAGIAQVATQAGCQVVVHDIAPQALERGLATLARYLRRGAERGRYSSEEAEAAIGRVRATLALEELAPCQVVIEAAVEDLSVKQEIFRRLEEIVPPEAILATNTSTLSVTAIARHLSHPERVCGLHFFNPAPLIPLVEVVHGAATAPQVLDRVTRLARAWGKVPIRAADTPGFIVNRVARPFYLESLRLLGEGVAEVATIDRLMRDAGFPMGPFELMDLIGIDVCYAATQSMWEGFFGQPRLRPHPILRAMVDAGQLGRKTGRGFYEYGDEP